MGRKNVLVEAVHGLFLSVLWTIKGSQFADKVRRLLALAGYSAAGATTVRLRMQGSKSSGQVVGM